MARTCPGARFCASLCGTTGIPYLYKITHMSRDFMKRRRHEYALFSNICALTRCPLRRAMALISGRNHHAGAACKQARNKENRGTCLGFILPVTVHSRKRRIFGGRVRQHAEQQLAVIAEMRDQHLRVPQREPRRRIGGQQVVQRVQIAAVVGRKAPHLGQHRAAARA